MESSTRYADLDRKAKIEYIWDYYKIHIIGAIIAIIIVFSLLDTLVFNRPEEVVLDITIRAMMGDVDALNLEPKEEKFEGMLGLDTKKERVLIDFLSIGENINPNVAMADQTKFMVKVEQDALDILIVHESYLPFLLENNVLSKITCPYSTANDDKIYSGENIVAVRVRAFDDLLELLAKNEDEYYVCVYKGTKQSKNVERILK